MAQMGHQHRALRILAGASARVHLRERGLQPQDVRIVPAAAGGPKGLALNHLDRYLFGQCLPRSHETVHLVVVSVGAWRMSVGWLRNVAKGRQQVSLE